MTLQSPPTSDGDVRSSRLTDSAFVVADDSSATVAQQLRAFAEGQGTTTVTNHTADGVTLADVASVAACHVSATTREEALAQLHGLMAEQPAIASALSALVLGLHHGTPADGVPLAAPAGTPQPPPVLPQTALPGGTTVGAPPVVDVRTAPDPAPPHQGAAHAPADDAADDDPFASTTPRQAAPVTWSCDDEPPMKGVTHDTAVDNVDPEPANPELGNPEPVHPELGDADGSPAIADITLTAGRPATITSGTTDDSVPLTPPAVKQVDLTDATLLAGHTGANLDATDLGDLSDSGTPTAAESPITPDAPSEPAADAAATPEDVPASVDVAGPVPEALTVAKPDSPPDVSVVAKPTRASSIRRASGSHATRAPDSSSLPPGTPAGASYPAASFSGLPADAPFPPAAHPTVEPMDVPAAVEAAGVTSPSPQSPVPESDELVSVTTPGKGGQLRTFRRASSGVRRATDSASRQKTVVGPALTGRGVDMTPLTGEIPVVVGAARSSELAAEMLADAASAHDDQAPANPAEAIPDQNGNAGAGRTPDGAQAADSAAEPSAARGWLRRK